MCSLVAKMIKLFHSSSLIFKMEKIIIFSEPHLFNLTKMKKVHSLNKVHYFVTNFLKLIATDLKGPNTWTYRTLT